MSKKHSNLNKLTEMVNAWNSRFPVGTPVKCRMDDDKDIKTVTTSDAQILSGHSAVIWMRDISGCYLLDRVRAL